VADTSYRIDREHDSSEDLTIAWNDSDLAIPWPLEPTIMSAKDASAAPLSQLSDELSRVEAMAG